MIVSKQGRPVKQAHDRWLPSTGGGLLCFEATLHASLTITRIT